MSELIKLTYKERSALERVMKSASSGREFQRAQALLLLEENDAVQDVCALLRVTRQSIYNWVERFQERRGSPVRERISDKARSGRPATVTGVIDTLIDAVIDSDPRDYQYNSTVWTAGLLQLYLADVHQEEVSRRSISYAIERLGLRWKHPRHTLALRDPRWRQSKGG